MSSEPSCNIFSSIEALSNHVDSKAPNSPLLQNIYTAKIPEIHIFERISKFKKKDFQYRWSLMILIVNLYNIFSAGYFLGTISYPSNTWLGLELMCESALFVDFFIRLFLRKPQNPNKAWFFQESPKVLQWAFLSLSSFPYSTIALLLSSIGNKSLIVLRFLKLLRIFQLRDFWTKQGLVVKNSYFYICQVLFIILATTHYCAMFWLFLCEYHNLECFQYENNTELYISAFYKASETLTGIVQKSTEDHSEISDQKILSVFIMCIGVILYGSIFVKVSIKMLDMNYKRIDRANKKYVLGCWCKEREIDSDLQQRIGSYNILEDENIYEKIRVDLPSELPISVQSEIALLLHKNLISKSKIFELGEPSFMMSMVRSFESQIFLPGDYIIRYGDSSDCMYFISIGLVEILATDGISRIALLDDGNYFGEIGILMNCCRTVSVRAIQPCILACMSSSKLLKILNNFPEHFDFLHDVATQRMKTCTKEDIDLEYDLVEDDFSSSDSDTSGELETPEYYASSEHPYKPFLLKMITVPHSKSQKGQHYFDPLSPFFYFWTSLLFISYTICVFLIPYSIAFGQSFYYNMIDIGCYFVFVLDIYVNYNSSIITKYRSYVHEKTEIHMKYLDKYFLLDVLAVIPSDWVYCSFECSSSAIYYLKLVRLFKGFRLYQLFIMIKNYSKISVHLIRPLGFVYVFFVVSHIIACSINSLPTTSDSYNYIQNLYWSYSIFSQTSYGDIGPKSVFGMVLSMVLMVLSKIFVVVLYADSSSLVAEYSKAYTDFVAKTRLKEQWMNHCKIPTELRSKVKKYLQLQWDKLCGMTDEEILNFLPESITTDLRLKLFSGITKSGLFPENPKGALLGIIRKCKLIIINNGTEVITQGEIGLEMYFILSGTVEVVFPNGTSTRELGEGCIFGELAIIEDMPGIRNATVTAKTDLTLGTLSLEDFKYVCSFYPGFEETVKELAMDRVESMEKAMNLLSENDIKSNERMSIGRFNMDENNQEDSLVSNDKPDNIERAVITSLLDTTVFENKKFQVIYRPWAIRVYENPLKMYVYLVVWAWNIVFIPYQIAFDIKFTPMTTFFEVFTMIFYICACVYYAILHSLTANYNIEALGNRKFLLILSFYHMILALPLALAFSLSPQNRILTIVFSYIRVTNVYFVQRFFSWLKKKKIFWFVFIHGIEIVVVFMTLSHLIACVFICIGRNEKHSWISYLDSYDHYEIYVNGFYWAVGSLLHTTVGDIVSVSDSEKIYNCIVQIFSFFAYGLLFGSITSIISTLNSNLRSSMYSDYSYSIKYIDKKDITHKYAKKIDEFFNFLWDKNRGITESVILKDLPQTIKSDIFMHLHKDTLQKSDMFTIDNEVNPSFIKSIYRLMSLQYYLIGDIILHIDDISFNMYFIVSGEVTIVSLNKNSVINTLKSGDYFGEANILFDTSIRTATAVSTKISQIGILDRQALEMLFTAYPEWRSKLLRISKGRLMQSFQTTDFDNINKICEELSEKFTNNPQKYKSYAKKTDLMIAKIVAEALDVRPLNKQLTLNIIHVSLILYSCFAIPLEITYASKVTNWVIVLEILCIGESILYTSVLVNNARQQSNKQLLEFYIKRAFLLDLASMSPFNLIFPLLNVYEPRGVITFLRVIRLLAVFRIHGILSKLIIHFKKLFAWFYISESLLYLIIFIHWVTSLLNYNNKCPGKNTYLDSLYFNINIVTSTGHTDSYPCGSTAKIQFCIVSIISTAAIAGINGLLAYIYSNTMNFYRNKGLSYQNSSEIVEGYDKIMRNFEFLRHKNMTDELKIRIESFAKFSAALEYFYGETVNKEIYCHLPNSIVENLIYEKFRKMLHKLAFLKDCESEVLVKKIALSLQAEIYLPNDYLIYKDDIGDEMYFISIGSVNIIAPDNSKVIKTLEQGDFFGEIALINNSRRMCSVIAQTLCLVFALKRKNFNEILHSFPDLLKKIRIQSEIRSRETTSIVKNYGNIVDDDTEQNKLFNHLSMYSMLSSSFASVIEDKHKLSLLSGMKNMRIDMSFETFAKDRSQLRIFKRRPVLGGLNERRKSQEALGKKLVIKRFDNLKNKWSHKI